jgi:hypothetical protein
VPAPAPLFSPDITLRRAPDVLWRDGAFGVVLLTPGTGEPLTLAGTGHALWEALAEPVSRAALALRLADEFGADADRVASDIAPVLDRLLRCGALEEVP